MYVSRRFFSFEAIFKGPAVKMFSLTLRSERTWVKSVECGELIRMEIAMPQIIYQSCIRYINRKKIYLIEPCDFDALTISDRDLG